MIWELVRGRVFWGLVDVSAKLYGVSSVLS